MNTNKYSSYRIKKYILLVPKMFSVHIIHWWFRKKKIISWKINYRFCAFFFLAFSDLTVVLESHIIHQTQHIYCETFWRWIPFNAKTCIIKKVNINLLLRNERLRKRNVFVVQMCFEYVILVCNLLHVIGKQLFFLWEFV